MRMRDALNLLLRWMARTVQFESAGLAMLMSRLDRALGAWRGFVLAARGQLTIVSRAVRKWRNMTLRDVFDALASAGERAAAATSPRPSSNAPSLTSAACPPASCSLQTSLLPIGQAVAPSTRVAPIVRHWRPRRSRRPWARSRPSSAIRGATKRRRRAPRTGLSANGHGNNGGTSGQPALSRPSSRRSGWWRSPTLTAPFSHCAHM